MPYADPEVRRIKGKEYTRKYRESHPELTENRIQQRMEFYRAHRDHETRVRREHYQQNKEELAKISRERTRSLRLAAIAYLGSQCANPNCRYLNEDGSLGCRNIVVLQIDHVNNDGAKDRKQMKSVAGYYKKVMESSGKYQLLCPTCNALKQLAIQIKSHLVDKNG